MEWIWLVALASFLLSLLVAWLLPSRLVPRDLPEGHLERRKVQIEIVRASAEVLGGAFFLVTLLVGWQQLQGTQEQLEVARQGQLTERFTRAIDQLGSPEVTVRVGGIYALERIARDSERDRQVVLEVLASFLRQSSPVTGSLDDRDWQSERGASPAADVEAAAKVIGRRERGEEPVSGRPCDALGGLRSPCLLDLRNVDFSSIDLSSMDFSQMDLRGSAFNYSNVAFTSLRQADLGFTDLRGANLRLADLTGASLLLSRLEGANMPLVEGLTCEMLDSAHDHGAGAANLTIRCR